MEKLNLQKELLKLAGGFTEKQRLLFHVCCAPCSSHCLEVLRDFFTVTLFFYNPNIDTEEEYVKRAEELRRFNKEAGYNFECLVENYAPNEFYQAVKGFENEQEGGQRCLKCYTLRFKKAFEKADALQIPYVCTSLSVSPHKDAAALYQTGQDCQMGKILFLPADFKKNGGFARTGVLSREYGLYRQDYCGCVFSKTARDKRLL